jgi:hypothetical protein
MGHDIVGELKINCRRCGKPVECPFTAHAMKRHSLTALAGRSDGGSLAHNGRSTNDVSVGYDGAGACRSRMHDLPSLF